MRSQKVNKRSQLGLQISLKFSKTASIWGHYGKTKRNAKKQINKNIFRETGIYKNPDLTSRTSNDVFPATLQAFKVRLAAALARSKAHLAAEFGKRKGRLVAGFCEIEVRLAAAFYEIEVCLAASFSRGAFQGEKR